MTENNIIDKVENYFEYLHEQFGDTLYLERVKKEKKPNDKTKKPKLKTQNSKLTTDVTSFDKIRMTKEQEQKLLTQNTQLLTKDDWEKSGSLDELYEKIHNCQNCPLGATRTNFVFGTGNPNADIMIIGEAPGADEDEQGKPFVGRAGQLLTKILEAIKLSRDEVFIANILKCRPPNNRKPLASEEDECEPYLKKQIELIKPAFILALGLTAVDCLLKKTHKMGDIRGSVLEYHGIKMLATYHPAALLRNPNWKKDTWEDVQKLRKLYDEYLENR